MTRPAPTGLKPDCSPGVIALETGARNTLTTHESSITGVCHRAPACYFYPHVMPARTGNTLVKVIVYVCLIAAIPAVGFYYYRERNAPKPPEFSTAAIARGDVIQTVTATGQLDPVLSVDVGSQISGLILRLHADFNSRVKKGDKLAEIDPASYEQRLRQAKADLASADASNKLARLNADRTQELYDKKLVTQQEFDQSRAQLAQSEATLTTRQAALATAEVDLARCTIYSPIDGIVLSKATEEGKTVAASLNAPTLFTIANDLAKMRITAAVAEADIGSVEPAQDVSFTVDAFPDRTFNGKVSQVRNAPKNTQNVVTYETIIEVDNRDLQLRPGMTANVSIVIARRDSVLRIPNAALRVRMPDSVALKQTGAPAGAATDAQPRQVAAASGQTGGAEARREHPTGGGAGEGRRERAQGKGGGGGRRGGGFSGNANLTDEQRAGMREIIQSSGMDFRSAMSNPGERARLSALLVAAGLPALETPGGARGPGAAATTRTVYRMAGGDQAATPEALSVSIGISDGFTSEILSGLNEGDTIITSVTVPGAPLATTAPGQQRSPLSGGRRGF